MEIGGAEKELFNLPQNILEGNGVVFEIIYDYSCLHFICGYFYLHFFFRMTTCGWKNLEITIVLLNFFKSHFNSNLFSHFCHCCEIGGIKKNYSYPPKYP